MKKPSENNSPSWGKKLVNWFLMIVAAIAIGNVLNRQPTKADGGESRSVVIASEAGLGVDELKTAFSNAKNTTDNTTVEISYLPDREKAMVDITAPADLIQRLADLIQKDKDFEVAVVPNSSTDHSLNKNIEDIVIRVISSIEKITPLALSVLSYQTSRITLQIENKKLEKENSEDKKTIYVTLKWKPSNRFSFRKKEDQFFIIPPSTHQDVKDAVQLGIKEGFTCTPIQQTILQ